jgi:microcompartment protein CcmL/EutN
MEDLMKGRSLGLIETLGLVPALEAADAACKSAMVSLLGYDRVGAGLVTVKLTGDVASVRTAVTAGAAAAKRVGKVFATHVIPRPDHQLDDFQSGPSLPPGMGLATGPSLQPEPPAARGSKTVAEINIEKRTAKKPASAAPKGKTAKRGKSKKERTAPEA